MGRLQTMDDAIIEFKDLQNNTQLSWDVWSSVQGTAIFGAIGSGKTSGSARTLALKMLPMGFGGLVLTTKPDEKDMWIEYCRLVNRSKDLIIIEPGGKNYFNFLEYESTDRNNSKSYTENIVDVLKTVIQASEEKSGGKTDDPFWESALDMLLYNTIELCLLAYGKVSIQLMYDIVLSIPKKDHDNSDDDEPKYGTFRHALEKTVGKISKEISEFLTIYTDEKIEQLKKNNWLDGIITKKFPDYPRIQAIDQFYMEHYRNLNEKTRSIVDFSFSGFLFRLTKEPVASLFCNNSSTVIPEHSLDGKIILVNLPVKVYNKVGRDCQTMFKYIWQRAVEKRDVLRNGRPVFLWADEAQNFLHSYDIDFQATARSSRVATVYISQSLSNYYAFMGSLKYKERISSLLGNLGTKIFHANTESETNQYASQLFGEKEVDKFTTSENFTKGFSFGTSSTKEFKRHVRPEEFVKLKTGGTKNNCLVEAYFHVQGSSFSNGQNFKKVTFGQEYIPSQAKTNENGKDQTNSVQEYAPAPEPPEGFDPAILLR